jgi:hypothetical protein
VESGGVDLFGVLATPEDRESSEHAIVLLNAGAIRRSGPGRMWTEIARRWAARGVPVLRLDLEGIGDAGGEAARDTDTSLYVPRFVGQVTAALDALEAAGHGRSFLLGGLCSGSFWAFQCALEDPRVTAALMLNPRLLVWDPQIVEAREARELVGRARNAPLRRLLTGHWSARDLVDRGVGLVRAARVRGVLDAVDMEAVADRVDASPARFVLAFSDEEPLHHELAEAGTLTRMVGMPNVVLETLPGSDHTLRPLAAQRAAHAVADRAIEEWRASDDA